jgi:CHAT domain-containing protein
MVSVSPLPLDTATPASHVDLSRALAVGADVISASRVAEFRPLPGMDQELSAVASTAGECTMLRGASATAANIERNLPAATVLHFAGHALISPQAVSLLVAPAVGVAGDVTDTWRPQAASCRKLALAVFGACSTARYDEQEALAPQNLPHFFLLAGTQHVVAALWNVDSLLVSEFMRNFYRQIRSGLTIEAAMRQTALAMRQEKKWSSPYYWSSFALFAR